MTQSAGGWQSVLEGEAAAGALGLAAEIAAALAPGALRHDASEDVVRVASLASGSAGRALFFDYAAQVLGEETAEEFAGEAAACLEQAVSAVAEAPMSFGLHAGFTGIAWTVEHLRDRPDEPAAPAGEEDANAEIDAALLALLARRPWTGAYDLVGGLAGLGFYALERLPRPAAAECLAAVVDRLEESAERAAGGAAWFTPPELLGERGRARQPAGHYDLGVAHGVPGVLPVLAAACRAGIREERARPLLEDAVAWVLAQRDRAGGPSCFPNSVGPDIEWKPARLAWCYGDAGVAAALLATARLAGREDWEREALAVADRAAARPVASAGVRDAGLCHGACGLAHLFNRLYQATGEERFAQAARLWIGEGLALRRPGLGVAGFPVWDVTTAGGPTWTAESGFLTGAAGIGLALLAAASEVVPAWDRPLLCEIPEPHPGHPAS